MVIVMLVVIVVIEGYFVRIGKNKKLSILVMRLYDFFILNVECVILIFF